MMAYLLITAAVFWTDFFVKAHMDKKYACKVVHPRFRDKIRLEKYYNKGAALNFLAKKPKWMRRICLRPRGSLWRKQGLPCCLAGDSAICMTAMPKGMWWIISM